MVVAQGGAARKGARTGLKPRVGVAGKLPPLLMYDGLKNLQVPTKTRHPRARRAARIVLFVGLAIIVGFVGSGLIVLKNLTENFKATEITLSGLAKGAPDGPLNILVLGSDRRDVVAEEDRGLPQFNDSSSGQRADTIILLHVSKTKRAVMVSFPRDLRVQIPGRGTDKLNAAYARGGAQLIKDTIEKFTGLPIHHYVEVNFNSFRAIVDAVGGVRIDVNKAIHDKKSGLNIPHAGCWNMKGQTALSYVRARYFDPTADLGRIARQQQFMRALLDRVKSIGFLLNLPRVSKLGDALEKGLRHDPGTDLSLARAVAAKLADAGNKKVDFRIIPNDTATINRVSYVIARPNETARLFEAIRADKRVPDVGKTSASIPKAKDVQLDVYNGTSTAGLARTHAAKLREKGYRVRYESTSKKYAVTTIVYQPGRELKAQLVAKRYKGAVLVAATEESLVDLKLYLGADRLVTPTGSPSSQASSPAPPPADRVCRDI